MARARSDDDGRDPERAFGRYRAIVDNFAALIGALHTPLDPVVWAHPERVDREQLTRLFAESGIESAPLAWDETALSIRTDRPGKHWGFWAGIFHAQEAASLVPVRVLDPQPGERVLDLCAAPGGKTARIALALGNRGTVVANERSIERLAALSLTIARLGLQNVTCTNGDGASYPLEAGPFDRVLVDAPCSAEGNARKNAAWRGPDPAFRARVTGLQRALLRRAARLCRPGGRIVYSTCTFAPEENEAIIDAVVRELAGELRVLPIGRIEGLATSPGVVEWESARFLPELADTLRLWPHVSGTGGFFVALLERAGGPRCEGAPRPRLGVDARESEVLGHFRRTFGMDEGAFGWAALHERGPLRAGGRGRSRAAGDPGAVHHEEECDPLWKRGRHVRSGGSRAGRRAGRVAAGGRARQRGREGDPRGGASDAHRRALAARLGPARRHAREAGAPTTSWSLAGRDRHQSSAPRPPGRTEAFHAALTPPSRRASA